jgi:uncharacterized membrane protein (DUF485 family)
MFLEQYILRIKVAYHNEFIGISTYIYIYKMVIFIILISFASVFVAKTTIPNNSWLIIQHEQTGMFIG